MSKKSLASKILPWIGAAAGIGLLGWVLRSLDPARFLDALTSVQWWLLVVLPAANLGQALLRAEKWHHMLAPLARVRRLRLFGAIMGGYFSDMIVPVRVGPLVRAWLVARLERMRTASLLATVALDRTIDGFVFLGFVAMALVLWPFPEHQGGVWRGIVIGAGVSIAALTAAVAAFFALRRGTLRRLAVTFPALTFPVLPDRWRGAAGDFIASFADGVVWPKEAWRVTAIFSASVVIKLFAVSYFVWAGLAFDIALRPAEYLFLMVFLGFLLFVAGILKIVGGFTAGTVFALELLGIDVETALAMTLVVQGTTVLTVALCGAGALWAQGVSIGTLRAVRE
ncbi:MAG: lysylphosphatidylglycerol synthase transmembrane domain-containing protein [Alphaproteobacteria bacterium]